MHLSGIRRQKWICVTSALGQYFKFVFSLLSWSHQFALASFRQFSILQYAWLARICIAESTVFSFGHFQHRYVPISILASTGEPLNQHQCRISWFTPAMLFHFQVLFIGTWWSNSSIRIHCDKDTLSVREAKAIFLLNHHYEVDWMFFMICAETAGVLGIQEI